MILIKILHGNCIFQFQDIKFKIIFKIKYLKFLKRNHMLIIKNKLFKNF